MASASKQSSTKKDQAAIAAGSNTTSIPNQRDLKKIEAQEQNVRELVTAAAAVLHGLGPDRARIAWILEDALMYLDEIGYSERESSTIPSQSKNTGSVDLRSLEQLVQGSNG